MAIVNTENLIQEIVDKTITDTNRSIFEPKRYSGNPKFDRIPHCIFYYHFEFADEGLLKITRYIDDHEEKPIPYDDVESRIEYLARNHKSPHPVILEDGQGLDTRRWEKVCYVVFLMDSRNWKFARHGPNGEPSIIVSPGAGYTENHTFFDGSDANVDVTGSGDIRSAVYFVNYMKKNLNGDVLTYQPDGVTRDSQKFKFDFYYFRKDSSGQWQLNKDDPTGTNLGPPSPPPPL